MFFTFFVFFIILQRLSELFIARQNERWMKERGAKEFGQEHYKWIVLLHISFFVALVSEVLIKTKPIHSQWPALLFLFFILQLARVWVISSLGKYWNTKIIILPGANVVKKGPFKWMKHPNYVIVTFELLIIPIIFQAYMTAIIFFILNQMILFVRIRTEERALRAYTNYHRQFT